MKNNKNLLPPNTFKEAIGKTPEIEGHHQEGLQAMAKYSTKIRLAKQSDCQGSIEIDEAVKEQYPQENRWDYALGYLGKVYFVEVHSADTSEVSVVLKKLEWLKIWLREKTPFIEKLKAERPYFWVQSGKFDILKNSPQYRKIATAGLLPMKELKLP